ncbi:sigma-70 family RNA polymerase sigma factor [Chitinophaga horti]|uniref:Sigma-70 family RNA polymerase sigma factor n=1 Tax=Chitinophaga horti TaxID=2920382 RepID=A0ABY6J4P7_9BACT|nr:sigma-70 family RNA polymerase sigma factor [Chitinophaga horti]UYQ94643.1 sigma-70 family RNA polymerase sigma factor [Chitinophaga horti]
MEFEQLLGAHQGIIHKVCRLYRDSREDREDLYQEIAYQLWKSYPAYRGEAGHSTWVYRIALNTAIAAFRRRRPDVRYPGEMPEKQAEGADEEQEYRLQLFWQALRQLPDGEKALMVLYLEDLNYREIAEVTGISENHVGVKLNRIRTKLKQLLKQ